MEMILDNTTHHGKAKEGNSIHTYHLNSINLSGEPTMLQNPQSDHLRSALIYCLDSKVKGPLIPLRLIGSFFDFIPARLGQNAALDNAVSCVCTIYQSTSSTPYHFNKDTCQSYVKSLSALRECLGHETLRMEPETLCASILLQICEVGCDHLF